jgi:hypothetical protein
MQLPCVNEMIPYTPWVTITLDSVVSGDWKFSHLFGFKLSFLLHERKSRIDKERIQDLFIDYTVVSEGKNKNEWAY